MNKYQEITEARKILGLPERATMEEIKSSYKKLIKRWHPDKSSDKDEKHNEMTQKINTAYNIIITYCKHYEYSFSREEIKNYLSPAEWWFERFGNDPLWSNEKNLK